MEVTGYSRVWLQQLSRRYNEEDPQALKDRRHQKSGARDGALLDEAQREEFAETLKRPPPEGGMWSGPKSLATR
jgi:glycine/D-amino acid oxidase-like deaminating enzyme